MMTAGALKSGMQEFCGTEKYYFHPLNRKVNYTDGFKWFLQSAECYWLLDILITEFYGVASEWTAKEGDEFFAITVESKDSKATIKAKSYNYEGQEVDMFKKNIDFTDLPEGEWKFYYSYGVILLPSEY